MAASRARIVARRAATPTVTVLGLEVEDAAFRFRPGQWVDFFVPQKDFVGGFSLCSPPDAVPSLTLAVKRSTHAPAAWVTNEAAVGDVVEVRVGGDATLRSPQTDAVRASLCRTDLLENFGGSFSAGSDPPIARVLA